MKIPEKNKSDENQQGSPKSDQFFKSVKDEKKKRGISNSGGQMSYQTDNKQASANKGKIDSNVQGK